MSYYVNVTDGQGVLLGRFQLDGLDLRTTSDTDVVGEKVADCMGRDAIDKCAALPPPDEPA